MNLRRFVTVLAGLALLAGCVPSLSPFFSEDDIVFEPGLLGSWSEEDSSETWTFSAHDPRSYRLVTLDDSGRRGEFDVHLARVGGRLFLDLYPGDPGDGMSDLYKIHLVPAHTFFLVEQLEPRLRIAYMDQKWLSKLLEDDPDAIAHSMVDDILVLTASTEALQEFVLRHVDNPKAFSDPSEMIRVEE